MKWKNLANYCLDYVLDKVGVSDSAIFLIAGGFSKNDLLELGYNEETIDSAIKLVNETWSVE
jgi:phosphoribosylformylglycinamidine (FGAM) synthase-like amidotransferase family enzyme